MGQKEPVAVQVERRGHPLPLVGVERGLQNGRASGDRLVLQGLDPALRALALPVPASAWNRSKAARASCGVGDGPGG